MNHSKFAVSSLFLIFSVVFTGCAPLQTHQLTTAQIVDGRWQLEIQKKALVANGVIARDATADLSMLDLSPFYDIPLPGLPSERDTPFRFLKPGTYTWDGVKFDVRGMIDPGFDDWDEVEFDYRNGIVDRNWWWKTKTNNIPVGRKCAEIDFLHGAYGIAGAPSNTVSQFVIHFINGHNETVPIIFGGDVMDSEFHDNFVPTNAVVWEKRLVKNAPSQPVFGFYVKKWINPFPDEGIETIDFEPVQISYGYSGAFLVAITIRPTVGVNQ
jgi:hypothetical protein